MTRYSTTLSIVINKKAFKDSDWLITLLTQKHGKIICIAKGAHNIRSHRSSSLQLGNIIKAHLYTKDNFCWLTECQTIVSFLQKPKNLAQINLLFYFLELVNLVIAENQNIDDAYQISRDLITSINHNRVADYLNNEIKLISALGFGLPIDIQQSFADNNFRRCQQLIQSFLETIIERPLESQKLFS